MYVTRPLSLYKKSPDALKLPPPEGPSSGILVIQDEEDELASSSSCLGLGEFLKELPFPQNRKLDLFYRSGISLNRATHYHHVAFIPALGQPLSSNLYYVIQPNGKHRGEAYTSLKEEDLDTFCCYSSVSAERLLPLDISNTHQLFEIFPRRSNITFRSGFSAKSVAPDGFTPKFLSRRWRVSVSTASGDSGLGQAAGVDDALRARHPEFTFSVAKRASKAVVVGKWYCPFMFTKEGTSRTLREEMRRPFYEMTLEQRWEQVFSCENDHKTGKTVVVDAVVQKETAVISGREAVIDEREVSEDLFWFRSHNNIGEETSVGLSSAIVERMKWEQERVGWVGGKEKEFRVKKVEEFEGKSEWKRFGCYVLVESFVLKRLDGSLVLTYAFRHHHQIRSKWE